MKKWLIFFLLTILLLIGLVLIFIPKELNISVTSNIKASANAVNRSINKKEVWAKSWPTSVAGDSSFVYENSSYHIGQQFLDGTEVDIQMGENKVMSKIHAIRVSTDSSLVLWRCTINNNVNPISRISNYLRARKLKRNLSQLLSHITPFFENPKNVYGVPIEQTSIKDSLLFCSKKIFNYYPSTQDEYNLFEKITKAIPNKEDIEKKGIPIMNITKLDSNQFQLMVAIPITKELKDQGELFFRKMIPGNFLVAEAKGGNATITKVMEEMNLYIQDYDRTKMAIPFQALLTNRIEEKDTAQWITKIYFPIY